MIFSLVCFSCLLKYLFLLSFELLMSAIFCLSKNYDRLYKSMTFVMLFSLASEGIILKLKDVNTKNIVNL